MMIHPMLPHMFTAGHVGEIINKGPFSFLMGNILGKI